MQTTHTGQPNEPTACELAKASLSAYLDDEQVEFGEAELPPTQELPRRIGVVADQPHDRVVGTVEDRDRPHVDDLALLERLQQLEQLADLVVEEDPELSDRRGRVAVLGHGRDGLGHRVARFLQ